MGIADPDEYRGCIQDVIAFFQGDGSRLMSHLHRKLEQTVEVLDFERAARLRDQVRRIDALSLEQQRIDGACRFTHALLVLPGASQGSREVWYLLRGQRWAQMRIDNNDGIAEIERRLHEVRSRAESHRATFVPNHHAVDEMSILARWMRKTPDHPALISLDGPASLHDVVRQVLAVDLSLPFGESVAVGEVAAGVCGSRDDPNSAH
jgi:hypothetical protein